MTAAEHIQERIQKLRALHEKASAMQFISEEQIQAVANALPALLDVAEWIVENGAHKQNCALEDPARIHVGVGNYNHCTCGFDAALKRLGEPDA